MITRKKMTLKAIKKYRKKQVAQEALMSKRRKELAKTIKEFAIRHVNNEYKTHE